METHRTWEHRGHGHTGHRGHTQRTGDTELSPVSGNGPRVTPFPAAPPGGAIAGPAPPPPGGPAPRHGRRARARARAAGGRGGGGGVRTECHRRVLPGAHGRGPGELRTGARPLPHLRCPLPWLHRHRPQETPVLPRQAAGRRAGGPRGTAGGARGSGRAAGGHLRPRPADPPSRDPAPFPQHLGAARWALGAGRGGEGHCGDTVGTAGGAQVSVGTQVPPDTPNSQLVAAGLRELAEETGLHLEPGTFSWHLLGLWESLFPPTLSWGPPRCHHIVTYLGLRSAEPREHLQARLCPSPCEVSAVAWLEPPVLEAIAATEEGAEGSGSGSGLGSGLGSGSRSGSGSLPRGLPATVRITELGTDGFRSSQIPTGILLRQAPARGPDLERVSTGTKFALGRWRGGPGRGGRE